EPRAEEQRQRAGDVEERGQQPDRPGEEDADWNPRPRIDCIAGRRKWRDEIENERKHGCANDGARREQRPALIREVRLDRHGEGEDNRGDEVRSEERRVGKECRCRVWEYREREKRTMDERG